MVCHHRHPHRRERQRLQAGKIKKPLTFKVKGFLIL